MSHCSQEEVGFLKFQKEYPWGCERKPPYALSTPASVCPCPSTPLEKWYYVSLVPSTVLVQKDLKFNVSLQTEPGSAHPATHCLLVPGEPLPWATHLSGTSNAGLGLCSPSCLRQPSRYSCGSPVSEHMHFSCVHVFAALLSFYMFWCAHILGCPSPPIRCERQKEIVANMGHPLHACLFSGHLPGVCLRSTTSALSLI